ncbi:MAG: type II toxin-antitoxin system Phd/YefM family antitoxin [Acidobacteriota bacterium]
MTMVTVSTRVLKDQLSSYLRRAERGEKIVILRGDKPVAALVAFAEVGEQDEAMRLAMLEARGLVKRPQPAGDRKPFRGPTVLVRGKLASEVVIEDRR